MLDWLGIASRRGAVFSAPVRRALFMLPFVLVAILLTFKIARPWTYWHVAGVEDGPIEWLTATIYLGTAMLAGRLAYRFHKAGCAVHEALAIVLFLAMFVIGMEEISWGQRLFGIASPEFFLTANRQQELNFHNLGHNHAVLDAAYLLVTSYAMTARFWVPRLLARVLHGRYYSIGKLVCPPGFLAPYFLVPFLLYLYYVNVPWLRQVFGPQWGYGYIPDQGYFMISRDQEPAECILALGFLLFVIWLLTQQSQGVWFAMGKKGSPPKASIQHRYFKG